MIGPIAQVQQLVARDFDLPVGLMKARNLGREACLMRSTAYYVAWTVMQCPVAMVARQFDRDRRGVMRRIESVAEAMKVDAEFAARVRRLVESARPLAGVGKDPTRALRLKLNKFK